MAEKFPRDRFDEIPADIERVGAHRAPRPRGRGWIAFGWAALATVILVGAGVFGLSLVNGAITFTGKTPTGSASTTPTPTPTPTPTVVPTVDPSLTVNVLNGTSTSGLGGKVGEVLTAAGWKVGAVANADMNTLTETIAYYADPTKEGAALGVAQSLPGAKIQNTQDFADSGADLTVVIGSNYTG